MGIHSKPQKAYNNSTFLNSADARAIRILSEFYEPKSRFNRLKIKDTVVFFGSARLLSKKNAQIKLKEERAKSQKSKNNLNDLKHAERMVELSKYYEDAVELGKRITQWSMKISKDEKRFVVCSGGGPGIMEAANKGAKLAGGESIGLNISIPFEQFVNKFVKPDHAFEFHYFFMRKLWFVYLAKALVVFPGGFGTMDELMEVLTLLQTKKVKKKIKIIVYGKKFWSKVINFNELVFDGLISKDDLKLFEFCDTVDEAFDKIVKHYKKHYKTNNKKPLI